MSYMFQRNTAQPN